MESRKAGYTCLCARRGVSAGRKNGCRPDYWKQKNATPFGHLFFCFAFFCNSRTPPATACCSCKLDISGFRKSLVIHAHRARPDCRVAKDCVANYFQCAEINGDMPLPNNKSPRSKECPIRRTKKAFRPRTNNKSPRSQLCPMRRPK